MQAERHKSLHATVRLVVSATVVSVLFAVQATAQQQPTASAQHRAAATQVAQSPDEAAFKQMLVKNSPWPVEWQSGIYAMVLRTDTRIALKSAPRH